MAKQTLVADLSLWEKRHQSVLGYINNIRTQRKFLKDVRNEEKSYDQIKALLKKHKITEQKKKFGQFIEFVRQGNKDFLNATVALLRVTMHFTYLAVALKKYLKEEGIEKEMPPALAEEEFQKINKELREELENLETARLMLIKAERKATE